MCLRMDEAIKTHCVLNTIRQNITIKYSLCAYNKESNLPGHFKQFMPYWTLSQ